MGWFDDVADHIQRRLNDYAQEFLSPSSTDETSKNIFVNGCPFCGHNDCFSLSKVNNAAYCFSCGAKGTKIKIVEQLMGQEEGRIALQKWSGINYPYASYVPEDTEAKKKYDRFQELCKAAVVFYMSRLWQYEEEIGTETISPSKYQLEVRKHEHNEVMLKYKIGYSGGKKELVAFLTKHGYTQEEIAFAWKELIGFPDGYFLYPYYDRKGNLVRINAKLFIRTCFGSKKDDGFCSTRLKASDSETKKLHEKNNDHKMAPDNLSKGERNSFLIHPNDLKTKKKYLILVEGENDLISTADALDKLPEAYRKNFTVACMGGNAPEGMFEAPLLREFEEVYEAFDNDDAGDKYRQQLDKEAPEVMLKRIYIPEEYNDIDLFLKTDDDPLTNFKEALDSAVVVPPENFRIERKGRDKGDHIWVAINRHIGLEYHVESYNRNKQAWMGTLFPYKNGIRGAKKRGDIDSVSIPGGSSEAFSKMKAAISDEIQEYYHVLDWSYNKEKGRAEPIRSFDDLLDIQRITKRQDDVLKQIAWYLHTSTKVQHDYFIKVLKSRMRNETVLAKILQEVNGLENQDFDPTQVLQRITLSQSLYPLNGDAYMYFAMLIDEGDDVKRVPCLLSNKKEVIRLDLMKRKEAQSLLLIDKKYELLMEVDATMIPTKSLSLQYKWVKKWLEDDIDPDKLSPESIIAEIEAFIRMTYYASDEVIKVLSVWIYATYYYRLFVSGFPYLQLNGDKGSGKSTLNTIIYLLSFNPTFVVNTSEASVFRKLDFIGGTYIMDEQETLNDGKKMDESGLSAILKAGYAEAGEISRVDPDTKFPKEYSAFGPKVIANINGVDAVIQDRCIRIETVMGPDTTLNKLQKPTEFQHERRSLVYDITSRAALSSLIHFQRADQIFKEGGRLETGNARLSQLIHPLIAIARLVGGDFEQYVLSYYENVIKEAKQDVKMETTPGKIEYILKTICEEILNLTKNRMFYQTSHDYNVDIKVTEVHGEKVFEIDSMHLKGFVEELDPDREYTLKEIHSSVMTYLKTINFDKNQNRVNTKLTIQDELLQRKMKGKHVNAYRYTLRVRDIISRKAEAAYKKEKETKEMF